MSFRRYMLFAGNNYYPGDGMNDWCGDGDTVSAAVENLPESYGWFQVHDYWKDQTHKPYILQDVKVWAKQMDEMNA